MNAKWLVNIVVNDKPDTLVVSIDSLERVINAGIHGLNITSLDLINE